MFTHTPTHEGERKGLQDLNPGTVSVAGRAPSGGEESGLRTVEISADAVTTGGRPSTNATISFAAVTPMMFSMTESYRDPKDCCSGAVRDTNWHSPAKKYDPADGFTSVYATISRSSPVEARARKTLPPSDRAHAAPGSIEVWMAIGAFAAFPGKLSVAGSYFFTARSISTVLPLLAVAGTETPEGIESISTHRSAMPRNSTGGAKSASSPPGGHSPNFCANSSPTAADLSSALAHDAVPTKAKSSNNKRRRLGRTVMMTYPHLSHCRSGSMIPVASPCHPYEPVKILDDSNAPLHCLVCGAQYAI